MTDEADVDLDQAAPITIDVGVGAVIEVGAGAVPSLAVPVVDPDPSAVDVAAVAAADVDTAAIAPVSIESAPVEESDVELLASIIMGLSLEDRAKLDSIMWGADVAPRDYRKIVDLSGTSTLGGDSVLWPGSNTEYPLAVWKMPANLWREAGVLDMDVTGSLQNDGAAPFLARFLLYVADAPPTTDDTSLAAFGIPAAWGTAVYTREAGPFPNAIASGSVRWHLKVEMHAEGHVGTTWAQTARASFISEARPASSPKFDAALTTLDAVAIDPTKDQWFKLAFLTTSALGADQSFIGRSVRVYMRGGRDGN